MKLKIFFEDKLMADTENARYTPAGVQPLGNEPKAQTAKAKVLRSAAERVWEEVQHIPLQKRGRPP